MAKQILTSFPFNAALNEALKDRFSATWDKAAQSWAVSSKAKALEANTLISAVVAFEASRRCEEVRIERHHVLAARHPEAAIFAAHPLTGELWVSRIPAELKEELEEIGAELHAAELNRLADEAAAEASAKAQAAAAQAIQVAAVAPALEKAAAIVAKAAVVKMEADALTDSLTAGVIDYPAICRAQQKMARAAAKVGSAAKADYRAAKAEIERVYDALTVAGLRSAGISALINMNFNRPDRDRPLSVGREQIFSLTEREPA